MFSFKSVITYLSALLVSASATPLRIESKSSNSCTDPIVDLDYATFRGTQGTGVTKFLGMPYATPPLGNLRFQPPVPPQMNRSNGTLDATKFGNICMQNFEPGPLEGYGLIPSEDCLFVNVWTPQDKFPNCSSNAGQTSQKLPVMVWIYGGSFTSGSSSNPLYEGQRFLKEGQHKAVFVSFNYRLGIFGFLHSRQIVEKGYGNVGLLDQRAVLEWVRKYIHHFGGDPDNVTLFGESAGAISVAAHLISGEGDQKLFHKAIIESGGLASVLKTLQNGQPQFDKLTTLTGCDTVPDENVFDCLRAKSPEELMIHLPALLQRNNFYPALDGVFIKRHPIYAYSRNLVSNIPLLIGTNTNEGTVFTQPYIKVKEDIRPWVSLNVSYGYLNKEEYTRTESLYNVSLYQAPFQAAGDLVADFIFHCPTAALASTLSRNNVTVFQYRFNRKPILSNLFTRGRGELGVFHFAEVPFVFRRGLFFAPLTGEKELSERMNEAWITFASTGNPSTPVSSTNQNPNGPSSWPQFDTTERLQLVFETRQDLVERDISRLEKCAFWMDYGKRLFDTVVEAGIPFVEGYPYKQMPVPGTPSEHDWD